MCAALVNFEVLEMGGSSTYLCWLVVWNIIFFSISWECHHPNWRTHIFQRGGSTTNQYLKDVFLATQCHSATPNTSTYGGGSKPIIINSNGMNIHLPAILMFTRGTRFWPIPIFQHWRFPQSISIDKRTDVPFERRRQSETGRESSSRQSGGQRRLSVNPKQCDPPSPDRYGGTPSYPMLSIYRWIFHYKPSSYWGTPIYGNLHTAHIAKHWWFSEPLGIQVQHFWKGIR